MVGDWTEVGGWHARLIQSLARHTGVECVGTARVQALAEDERDNWQAIVICRRLRLRLRIAIMIIN